jgi:hypothetical protein
MLFLVRGSRDTLCHRFSVSRHFFKLPALGLQIYSARTA